MKRAIGLGICLCLLSSGAFAQKKDEPQPCSAKDLIGIWEIASFVEEPQGDWASIFKNMPYQYVSFAEDGTYLEVHSNQPYRQRKNVTTLLAFASADLGYKYETDGKGSLYLREKDKLFAHLGCWVAKKTGGGYQAGDVIMTERKTKASIITRIYRRMKFTD